MPAAPLALQLLSISTAFLASGGLSTLSLFSVPMLSSQPASRALPMTRWLFSRGAHIFPSLALLSSSGFAYLAWSCVPAAPRSLSSLVERGLKGGRISYFLGAAALTVAIAPWTVLVMRPTNARLGRLNEELGGTRIARSAAYSEEKHEQQMAGEWPRNAEESVDGMDDVGRWWDLSAPQERTRRDSSRKQDEEVWGLLERFQGLNWVRAGMVGVGGVLGLMGALR